MICRVGRRACNTCPHFQHVSTKPRQKRTNDSPERINNERTVINVLKGDKITARKGPTKATNARQKTNYRYDDHQMRRPMDWENKKAIDNQPEHCWHFIASVELFRFNTVIESPIKVLSQKTWKKKKNVA